MGSLWLMSQISSLKVSWVPMMNVPTLAGLLSVEVAMPGLREGLVSGTLHFVMPWVAQNCWVSWASFAGSVMGCWTGAMGLSGGEELLGSCIE